MRIAELYLALRKLTVHCERVRAEYDVELIAARREQISYGTLADAVLVATGAAGTVDQVTRVEWVLRSATRTALRRRGVKGAPAEHVDDQSAQRQDDGMTHDPYLRKRRIVEEEFGPPPGDDQLDGVDDDFDDDDDEDQDHDLGDPQGPGPGPR